jgi:site-specific recombinase
MRDIHQLLVDIDQTNPPESLATRHLWLIEFIAWIRDEENKQENSVQQRIEFFLDTIDSNHTYQQSIKKYWSALADSVDFSALLADFGFAPRAAFFSALAARVRRKIVPKTPETNNAAELFELVFHEPSDTRWLADLDQKTLARIGCLLSVPSRRNNDSSDIAYEVTEWESALLDSITYCSSQIRASGFSSDLRLKQNDANTTLLAFHSLASDVQAFKSAYLNRFDRPIDLAVCASNLSETLEGCRLSASSVYLHLQEFGVSVGTVFQVRQLRERIVRLKDLIDCLLADSPRTNEASTARLLSRMVSQLNEMSSIRALLRANTSMLAAKITKQSAETGERYITRDASQFRSMLAKAIGGGAIVSLTTWAKFALAGVAASVFWDGFLSSMNYAISFIVIQLMHLTLATKQPAMTAAAIAAKLNDIAHAGALHEFVDEVANVVRSQVIAVFGNLLMVIPCVALINFGMEYFLQSTMLNQAKATQIFDDLNIFGPSLLFAVLTGLILFASSMIAGWVENWFVLNRIESALRFNPRISHILGSRRADSWACFWRDNVSGIAACVSLALMLGLIPAFATFFGIGLQVRHVTLSAGQLAAAASTFGSEVFTIPAFWFAVSSIPIIGLANIGISFYCSFRLAIKANSVTREDQIKIRNAVFQRLSTKPSSFIWPVRKAGLPKKGAVH